MDTLAKFSKQMDHIVTEEENLQQLDQLWDMYASGVNAEIFDTLVILDTESLRLYPEENIFYKIMVDFIVNYRKAYGC